MKHHSFRFFQSVPCQQIHHQGYLHQQLCEAWERRRNAGVVGDVGWGPKPPITCFCQEVYYEASTILKHPEVHTEFLKAWSRTVAVNFSRPTCCNNTGIDRYITSTTAGVLEWPASESELAEFHALDGPSKMIVQLAPSRGKKRPHKIGTYNEYQTSQIHG